MRLRPSCGTHTGKLTTHGPQGSGPVVRSERIQTIRGSRGKPALTQADVRRALT